MTENPKPSPTRTATLFIAGVLHANGNTYTEKALEEMARLSPYTLFTERDRDGRLCLKAKSDI